jgi:uncharacterized protein YndB with AHSA1/START domain
MSNTINNHNISIKSPVDKVWEALTTSEGVTNCLPNIKVVSNWVLGSEITYTCYEADGITITEWNNKKMIWEGVITELTPNKVYSVEYSGSGGIIKETYTLQSDNDSTELNFTQECVDEETAKAYKEGNEFTQQAIKEYLEK